MNNPTLLTIAQKSSNQNNLTYSADLTKKSGILKTMWWQKANSGLKHRWQMATDLPNGEFRQINSGISPADVVSQSGTTDLMCLESMHQADRDIIDNYPGGLKQYIADKSAGFLYGMGANFSRQLIYGTENENSGFTGLKQKAEETGNIIELSTGETGNDFTSIIAVRWAVDECSGLFDSESIEKGLVNINLQNEGKWLYKTINNREYPVYQFSYHGWFGMQAVGNNNVAVINGIKDTTNGCPKADDIDKLLDMVLAETDGSTFLYMNRKAKRLLNKLKNEKIQLASFDTDWGSKLDSWNGVPIIVDDNILSTEAK